MAQEVSLKNIGLRGVTVADTRISFIDGLKGILLYRGYRIEDLAQHASFAETAYLLLEGRLPTVPQLKAFSREMAEACELPAPVMDALRSWPREADPMDVLQAAVPLLATVDPELADESRSANVRKAVRVLARMATVVAAWRRIRSGKAPLAPREDLSHGANFLWQFTGELPDPESARGLELSMILQAEHTFNASTFACREVASTRAHLYAGVAAGVGAISGRLHGGANARVMRMLLDLESQGLGERDMPGWVAGRLSRREKIMGMGHAVYKTFDPRATILKAMAERLAQRSGEMGRFRLLSAIEAAAVAEFERRGKPGIKANVDFYSGLVYQMMGIPIDCMTPLFAMSLACGWCAHIIEEKFAEAQERPALYRPQAEYIGHYCGPIGCRYLPIDVRQDAL